MTRLIKTLGLLLAVLAGTPQGLAQSAPPLPVASRETSPGGIPFARALLPDADRQSIQIYWREASLKTDPTRFWLMLLAGPMIAAGPEGMKRAEFSETLKDLQAGFRLDFTPDAVHFAFNAKPDQAAEAARLTGAMLARPMLPRERLERFRKQSTTALEQEREHAEALAGKIWLRRIIASVEAGPALSRDPQLLEQASRDALGDWMRKTMTRDALAVATAGPMDAAGAGALIDTLLAGLPASGTRPVPKPLTLRQPAGLVALQKDAPQTVIMAGGPARFDDERDLALVSVAVGPLYASGLKSRMYANLREKLGATYGVRGFIERFDDRHHGFGIRSAVDHGRAEAALAALKDEYARWHADGLSEEEFENSRTQQLSRLAEQARTAPFVAGVLARGLLRGGRADALTEQQARLKSLTRAEVNAFIRKAFPAPPLALVVVSPTPQAFAPDCLLNTVSEVTSCK